MSPQFIAAPPQRIEKGDGPKYLWRLFRSMRLIVWQILTPFKSRPEEIDEFPEPTTPITESHVKQCQWFFDQAEKRHAHLEQKAQWTFGLMAFLVPLLSSLFVFIISKARDPDIVMPLAAIVLLVIAAIFLLLGFISAVRAVSVKAREALFLYAVIDKEGQFKEYSMANHARGLLYCASMNQAVNDHLAQFVKGAHLLTILSVITLTVAAVITSFAFSKLPSSPTETKIVGSVDITSLEVLTMHDDVVILKQDVGKLLANNHATAGDLKRLEEKFAKLDAKLNKIQKAMRAGPAKK